MKMNIRKIVLLQIVFLCLGSSAFGEVFYDYEDLLPGMVGKKGSYNGTPYVITEFTPSGKTLFNSSPYPVCPEFIIEQLDGGVPKGICNYKKRTDNRLRLIYSHATLYLSVDPNPPEPPNPCEDKEGQAHDGLITVSGFSKSACVDGCEVFSPAFLDGVDFGSDWVYSLSSEKSFFNNPVFTGEQCSNDTSTIDPPPEEPNPDLPYSKKCQQARKACENICSNGLTPNFTCDPETGDYDCECTNPLYPSDPTPTPDDITPKEGETDAEGATETDKANLRNQGKVIAQGEDIKSLLTSHGSNLESIADNTGKLVTAIGSGQLGAGISNGVKRGMEGALDGVEDGLGDVDNELEDLQAGLKGTYIAEEMPDEIIVESETEVDFGVRTQQFLDDMSQCSLFSVVDGLDDLSGSGSAIISIDGGETFGSHKIDFSSFDSGLNALRYVFHLMGMIIGLRILTLKR